MSDDEQAWRNPGQIMGSREGGYRKPVCANYSHPHEGKNCRCLKLCQNCGRTREEHSAVAVLNQLVSGSDEPIAQHQEPAQEESDRETFTFDELRMTLVAFSMSHDPLRHNAEYHRARVDRWLARV